MGDTPEIFFHVGMGKVASTYLQYRVFPYFKGIRYVQRTNYRYAKTLIPKLSDDHILISREFDQQMEREVKWFSEDFPDAHPIILFRRHDSWIASQYRRFTKNGFGLTFEQFFDLENDQGYFKQKDLNFYRNIEILEQHFKHKPLVMFYDDMRKDPMAFFKRIADHCGATFDPEKISLDKKHSSYSPKQLRVIYALSRRMDIRKYQKYDAKILNLGRRFLVNSVRYPTLFVAKFLPESWFGTEPLISKETLEKIRLTYADDWARCQSYANTQNL
ncbi:MAG: sulfotransferase domain-containing protein [Bacteroidota bacterium]